MNKRNPLILAVLFFTGAYLFPIPAYSQDQVAIPPENEKKDTSVFSDKAQLDGKDASIALSIDGPIEKDSCFPILYGEKEPISLDFQNANIRNLFRIISEFSGFNVIFSPELKGSVNIRVYDMPWNQALEIILTNSDLGRECFGNNVVRIASRKTIEAEVAARAEKQAGPSVENTDSCFPVLYGKKELVSLDFQNANISNLFRIISEVSGFNLILSEGVSGFVNIRMLDVPWNDALEIILANSDLGRECFVKGTVRIAHKKSLNQAPKIAGAERDSEQRLLGKELEDIPPVALDLYKKIQDEHPELLKKITHFESVFNNGALLQEMSDEDYKETLDNYKEVLNTAGAIKISKSPLQREYEAIRFTGVISIKNEKVALFEGQENKGYTVRKGDRIGPNFGYVDDIQLNQVVVLEKARDYLGIAVTNKHSIALYQGE
ncbi:MAG: hypothetical protein HOF21_00485 [Nitrospina sp.]|nr:hypothetical protein [Nitrospina sp.]MBT5632461.1 hypothetical protein [Nitrospina sp.]